MIPHVIVSAAQAADELRRFNIRVFAGPWRPQYVCPHRAWAENYGAYWRTVELPEKPGYDRARWNCIESEEDFENEIKKQIIATDIEAQICVGQMELVLSVTCNPFGIDINADDRNHLGVLVRLAEGPWAWWDQYSGRLADLPDDLGDIGVVSIPFARL